MTDIVSPSMIGSPAQPKRLGFYARLWRKAPLVIRASVVVFAVLLALAVIGPFLAPYDPNGQTLLARLKPPVGMSGANPAHLLGTDQLGRDLLSRLLHGLRLTLGVAFIGSLISLVIGTTLGVLAGYMRGCVDQLIMAMVDVQLGIPFTLVILVCVATFGNSLLLFICILGLTGWESYARIVRAQVLGVARMPFVEAAIAAGAGRLRILRRNVLPNIASPIIVIWTMSFSGLLLTESSLSFLGLGVQPPTATLGSMVGMGRDYLASAPWIALIPALAIMSISLLVLLIGDWLRDALDVRLR